jgi:hypothetical protein
MKRTVTDRTTFELVNDKKLYPHPNPDYDHANDAEKSTLARKGQFGDKGQLQEKLGDVKEKFPGLHITHRHNNTVR